MSQIFNVGWQNANSQRAYPLTSWATRIDTTGQLSLPNAFIVGLRLSIDSGSVINPSGFYISAIDVTPPLGFTISISYASGEDPQLVASATIPGTHEEGTSYFLRGVGEFSAAVGNITIGDISEMNTAAPGTYDFAADAGQLEVDAITPLTSGVSSITVINGLESSPRLTGDIELVAGNNQRLSPSQDAETNITKIIFSAMSTQGLNQDCGCAEDLGPPIRSINGVFSDSSRNLQITNGPCIEIEQIANGLLIKNTCATPCCSCKELDKIQTNLDRFADGVATLNGFAVQWGSQVFNMVKSLAADSPGTTTPTT